MPSLGNLVAKSDKLLDLQQNKVPLTLDAIFASESPGLLHWDYCSSQVQLSEQYEENGGGQSLISYTTYLRCETDLVISIVSFASLFILSVGLLQVLMKFCYHREKLMRAQALRMGINKSANEIRNTPSDQDPYKAVQLQQDLMKKSESRRCLKDATFMLKTSARFYLFTFLLLLNLLNFIGEFFFHPFDRFLRIRAFIIVSSIMIFQITIIYMVRQSSKNLSEASQKNKMVKYVINSQIAIVAVCTIYVIYLFIDNLIK